MNRARVIKSTGKFYTISNLETQEILQSSIRGKFKLQGLKVTNPVAVGDVVHYDLQVDGSAVIIKIENRENYVVRQSPRKKHYVHLLASNVDQAFVIVTIREPNLKQGFIDRFLLMTEPYNIPVTIVFNKADIYTDKDRHLFVYFQHIYQRIGYTTLLTSTVSNEGLDTLQELLANRTSLIAGQSGVGKSSIINKMVPSLQISTQDISDYSGKGQHTTTFAEMHELPFGGSIIDTPGIKTLGFNHLEVMDVAHNFRELFEYSDGCKFNNCTHRDEPKCAIKNAVQEDKISELRYLNYLQIVEDIENQNYWERIKDY